MTAQRPCIDCGAITTNGTRCRRCHHRYRSRYRGDWPAIAAATVIAQPWCSWCGVTVDLVADHIVPGQPEHGTRTLCRPCNSARAQGATGPTGGGAGHFSSL